MLLILQVLLYFVSFFAMWAGAGLIISAVDKASKSIKMSRFALSFIVLGLLTSIPEAAVGLTSIVEKDPEIFVGNLLGGIVVIFLLVIPLLAIFGNGISLRHKLDMRTLFFSLVICVVPSLLIADRRVGIYEAIAMILLYLLVVYLIERKQSIMESIESVVSRNHKQNLIGLLKIAAGLILVFAASDYVVKETLVFSSYLNISPFAMSVAVLSLGTNLPELLLAVRGIIWGKKDIAFGDYLGSATANTFIFGIMVLLNGGTIVVPNHFLQRFIFIFIGLILFYFFARSKRDISRREGVALLLLYICFVIAEFITG